LIGKPNAWLSSFSIKLLGRIFSTLRAQNPALSGDKKKYTIVPPVVQRDGSKKTMFSNVVDICKRMHRQPDHVIQFLFSELGTVGSVDGSQRLVIKGRFMPVQIEKVLRKYIGESLQGFGVNLEDPYVLQRD
jgi:translation initiation factor 2 subunit 2